MTDLILNVDFVASEPPKKKESGNQKHRSFVQRRRVLERRGVLRQKQLPPPGSASKPGPKRQQGGKTPKKAKPPQPAPCPKSNSPSSLSAAKTASTATQPPSKPKPVAKAKLQAPRIPIQPSKLVAIDCEMVGTGPGGRTSDLARCSIVGYHGDILYDRYIRPAAPIVDYRTRWSGIRRHHMVNAVPFSKAQREILRILSGKIVVGHAISNDFKALKYFHPKALTRDTSRMPLLNRRGGFPENISVSLKRLTKELLHRDIQVGTSGHSSVEDARATMELYKVVEAEWEQHLLLNPEQE
ncbi:interferon-stimulated 20 kDa exonuclease-like 2 [Cuculus canorus]|uniref:interferon-stimulated 20 kDa exonuclease-like 2 n=1 Tax=Cuculus canorus TaxID=55661 RepID=UPI0023AA9649|nr:interferon-stimulated 20 kDa exonuclease-like 2 [Cuculus canorus]XP_053907063.1 interferon-stimulated 20 kDa exonuclease-like 2 [Cuculus canorus]